MLKRLGAFVVLLISLQEFSYGSSLYVPNEVLVQTKTSLENSIKNFNTQSVSLNSKLNHPFFKKYNFKGIKKTFKIPFQSSSLKNVQVADVGNKSTVYVLNLEKGQTVSQIVEQLKLDPDVIHVQPNFIYKSFLTPNDTLFSQQYAPTMVKLPQAWSITTGNKNTIIAIIDTGVQITHPDLVNQIWSNPGNSSIKGVNFITNPISFDPSDDDGHGTHVAGIAAAQANNNKGVAGAGFNCTIMALKAGDSEGFLSSDIINAIDYAIDNGAKVINLSLGSTPTTNTQVDTLFKDAVERAIVADIVVVAAAGNDKADLDLYHVVPASYPNVIAVSAANQSGNFDSRYSNFGASVSLLAPGTGIVSTYPINNYALLTGTSMASPLVAGIVGLIRSYYPSATRAQIYSALTQTATDLGTTGRDSQNGFGMVNAFKALSFFDNNAPTIIHTKPSSPSNINVPIPISATITDNMIVASATVYVRDYRNSTPLTAWRSVSMSHTGSTYTASIINTVASANALRYYIQADDGKPNTTFSPSQGASSPNVVTLQDLTAPTITPSLADGSPISLANLTFSIVDNVGVATSSISVDLTTTSTTSYPFGSTEWSFSGNTLTLFTSFLPTLSSNDSVTVKITAKDTSNLTATKNVTYTKDNSFEFFGPQGPGSPILNVPNPFNPDTESTKISFQTSQSSSVDISIYTLDLRLVKRFKQDGLNGYQQISWDGKDESGARLPNGVYVALLRATSGGKTIVRKLKIALVR